MNRVIYGVVNGRFRETEDMLIMMFCEFSNCSEGYRKGNSEKLYRGFANIFMWLLGFCNRTSIDLEEIIKKRYALCPYCRKTFCECSDQKSKVLPDENPALTLNFESLRELQEHLDNIYGKKNEKKSITDHLSHIAEEIGETTAAYIRNEWDKVAQECADVLAWLIAFCNYEKISLQEIVWRNYPGVCNLCNQPFCQYNQPVVHREP